MRACESPARTLGDLTADRAGKLIAAAVEVAPIIDDQGVIRDLAFGSEDPLREAEVGAFADAYPYTLDDLSQIVQAGSEKHVAAVGQADPYRIGRAGFGALARRARDRAIDPGAVGAGRNVAHLGAAARP